MAADGVEGLLVVDKAPGPTSHDVVASVRRLFATRRCGHGGTLDPPASGVLLVALGRATRLLRFVLDLPKSYRAELVLGTATTTLDDTGEVTEAADMAAVSAGAVQTAANTFVGTITQLPPMVSAVQVGGRRLHELARAGIEVERSPRTVRVERFEVARTSDPLVYEMHVDCSSGTYVRALADDLGRALGGVAHLRRLRRVAIGPFTAADAVTLDEADERALRPAGEIVGHLARLEIAEELARAVAHGKVLERSALGVRDAGPWALFDRAGELQAVYEAHGDTLVKPTVVMASSTSANGR